MSIYVRLDGDIVAEVIQPAIWPAGIPEVGGTEIPIDQRYTSTFVAMLVDVTNAQPQPSCGWSTADGGKTFTPPPSI